jgi:hypothetical protein
MGWNDNGEFYTGTQDRTLKEHEFSWSSRNAAIARRNKDAFPEITPQVSASDLNQRD